MATLTITIGFTRQPSVPLSSRIARSRAACDATWFAMAVLDLLREWAGKARVVLERFWRDALRDDPPGPVFGALPERVAVRLGEYDPFAYVVLPRTPRSWELDTIPEIPAVTA